MRLPLLSVPLVLAAAFAPAPAHALELAVQDDAVLLHRSYGDPALALDRARDLGADRIRVNVAWSGAMPRAQARARRRPRGGPDYRFDALERLLADAQARGLDLQVTLAGPAPAWATSNRRIGYTRPDARAYAAFAGAAATAFVGRIDRWSVWNEPNWDRLLQPTRSAPRLYRGLFRRGSAAIRSAAPRARVLIGEMMPGANRRKSAQLLDFLRGVTCSRRDWRAAKRCAPLEADGFALHPYNFAKRPRDARPRDPDVVEIGSLGRLTKALDKLRRRGALVTPRGRRMPLYLTEFGYFTAGPVAQRPRTQARWMGEAWDLAKRNRRVRQLLQYGLIDPWPRDVTWRTAIMDRHGEPRPAYRTLQARAR